MQSDACSKQFNWLKVHYFHKSKLISSILGSRLNDTLRLLMLWFDFGDRPEVFEQLRDSLKLIPPEVWLEVVPQLIARLVKSTKIKYKY